MSPTGVRSGRRAPARGNGGPPSGRGAVLRVSGRTRPVTGDTTPYDQRPAELHNPRITQATYMSIWESAHLAGRRCRVEIRPPYRAPVPCGNPPTLPGAGAVWKSAHLAGRRCRVGIRPPCRAPVPCGNPPTLPGAGAVWKFAHLHDKNLSNDRLMCADLCQTGFCLSIIENRNFPESSILYLASKGVFSFICLSAGSRKDRFNSAKFFCWDSGKRKRSFNQA
ncbi:Uncharacterised protein [Shigella flexneri]|nr:Uncharacterised protein [Shigella flexneri]